MKRFHLSILLAAHTLINKFAVVKHRPSVVNNRPGRRVVEAIILWSDLIVITTRVYIGKHLKG